MIPREQRDQQYRFGFFFGVDAQGQVETREFSASRASTNLFRNPSASDYNEFRKAMRFCFSVGLSRSRPSVSASPAAARNEIFIRLTQGSASRRSPPHPTNAKIGPSPGPRPAIAGGLHPGLPSAVPTALWSKSLQPYSGSFPSRKRQADAILASRQKPKILGSS